MKSATILQNIFTFIEKLNIMLLKRCATKSEGLMLSEASISIILTNHITPSFDESGFVELKARHQRGKCGRVDVGGQEAHETHIRSLDS